jgi:uncharacterized membrane protein YfcA
VTLLLALEIMAIGAGIGFLGGLFGKGGSAIATPLLVLIGIPPIIALASPLPATIPANAAASVAYWRERRIEWRVLRTSLAIGVPATALGAYLTRWIGGDALVIATEILITGLGVRFLLRPGDPDEVAQEPANFQARLILVSGTVGLVSGLLANSGGFLLAPLYIVALRLPIKEAFASSLAVASVLAIPGTLVHLALGHIDWAVVGLFASASIPLAYLGARVALRTHAIKLERWYGLLLAVLGPVLLLTAR